MIMTIIILIIATVTKAIITIITMMKNIRYRSVE